MVCILNDGISDTKNEYPTCANGEGALRDSVKFSWSSGKKRRTRYITPALMFEHVPRAHTHCRVYSFRTCLCLIELYRERSARIKPVAWWSALA